MPVDSEAPVRSEVVDLISLAATVALLALVAFDVTAWPRELLALAFLTFVPGWAIVTNWPSAAKVSRVALSVLLSVAISAGLATVTLWVHVWHPLALFYATALISLAAITFALVRRRTHAPPA